MARQKRSKRHATLKINRVNNCSYFRIVHESLSTSSGLASLGERLKTPSLSSNVPFMSPSGKHSDYKHTAKAPNGHSHDENTKRLDIIAQEGQATFIRIVWEAI
eukprot:3597166-Amphidinium_carterae.1